MLDSKEKQAIQLKQQPELTQLTLDSHAEW